MVEVQEALSRKLMAITGLDIFNKTRKRDYVEARALLMFVFSRYLNMSKSSIARYFIDRGKPMNHATVIHHLNSWDITVKFNPVLARNLNDLLGGTRYMNKKLKAQYIQDKVPLLTDGQIDKLYELSMDMYEIVLKKLEENPVKKYDRNLMAN